MADPEITAPERQRGGAITLKTKTARAKLAPRREPYWLDLGDGCAIGYRAGAGTWVARWYDPHSKKHHYNALKGAVEFEDAKRDADGWWRTMSGGAVGTVQRGTVQDALDAYVKDLREHGRNADDIERRIKLTVTGKPLASVKLEKLARETFAAWRAGLTNRRANRTVNREVRAIAAGLNWAVQFGGYAGNPLAWTLQPLADDVDDEPAQAAVFLSREQRAALIEAATESARVFLRALEGTGARPGELAAATVGDFKGAAGTLTLRSRKGRSAKLRTRTIELTDDTVALLKAQSKSKLPKAALLTGPSGGHWQRHEWAREVRAAVKAANDPPEESGREPLKGEARIPVAASAYSFRHASISEALTILDPVTVARHHGTSIAMIERTYMHFVPGRVKAALEALRVAK